MSSLHPAMNNNQPPPDSTKRFSDRVKNYVLYRPNYPQEVISVLEKEAKLTSSTTIADIGSGTGISTRLFLDSGNTVYAVEPNDAMRHAAESFLHSYPNFHSVNGNASDTTLADHSVDLVTAAQAFHWFKPDRARREFNRILKPGGKIVLIWNRRKENDTPFLTGYEALLMEYGTDYDQVKHTNIDDSLLSVFFETYTKHVLYNEQLFNFEGLKGRLLSSSYAPAEGHPNHEPMLWQLRILFDQYNEKGLVRFVYDTEIYIGNV